MNRNAALWSLRLVAVACIVGVVSLAVAQDRRQDRGRGDDRQRREDSGPGDRGPGGPGFGPGGPGFGGPGFGGGGPGFGGGGGGFGGPGFGRGFGGGFGGGGGPQDFLRRMDRNGNNMLDPDETEAARPFLERIARQVPNIDFSRPVPIDRLADAMERMRRDRFGDGGGGRGEDDDRGPATPPPLVPGFGSDVELSPVPGFGSDAELFSVEIDDRDRRAAEDRMRRYDRNGDGVLSGQEIDQGRWGDDPLRYDRNKDGKLTADEMAVRYAQRRVSENGDGAQGKSKKQRKFYSPGGSSSSSSAQNSGPQNPEADERMNRIAEFTMARFDSNGNGKLEREEYANMPNDPSGADRNKDGAIDRKELASFLASSGFGGFGRNRGGGGGGGFGPGGGGGFGPGGGGGGFGPGGGGFGPGGGGFGPGGGGFGPGSGGGGQGQGGGGGGGGRGEGGERRFFEGNRESGNSSNGKQDDKQSDQKKSLRSKSAMERLTAGGIEQKDLPEWFVLDDRDKDGQVSMSEFSKTWSDSVVAEYEKFDPDNDGYITAREAVAANKNGSKRSGEGGSGGPKPNEGGDNKVADDRGSENQGDRKTTTAAPSSSAATTSSSSGGGANAKIKAYAANKMKEYDKNSDGELTEDEWSSMSKSQSPASADADKNGKISLDELTKFYSK